MKTKMVLIVMLAAALAAAGCGRRPRPRVRQTEETVPANAVVIGLHADESGLVRMDLAGKSMPEEDIYKALAARAKKEPGVPVRIRPDQKVPGEVAGFVAHQAQGFGFTDVKVAW
ncbi:MAG: biopolymer transporter ExbD [Kiritimatiellae bacterium]|nr:biopolymer transporter ExbD [Kiritimatiellia bacterium]